MVDQRQKAALMTPTAKFGKSHAGGAGEGLAINPKRKGGGAHRKDKIGRTIVTGGPIRGLPTSKGG